VSYGLMGGRGYRSHQLQSVDARAAICWRSDLAAQAFRYFAVNLLFRQEGGEVIHLQDLADFDFGVADSVVHLAP
jgi:hypothetical protein